MADSQEGRSAVNNGRLHDLLRRSSRLALVSELACKCARALCVLLGALLLALALDAVLALRPWGLIALARTVPLLPSRKPDQATT